MGERTKFHLDIRGYHQRVTGSCIRNTAHFSDGEKFRFLVDDGVYQGEAEQSGKILAYNDCVNPEKINAVLLTHTHLDHDGALPMFVKQGYNKNIYMSSASSILLPVSLEDSYNVMKATAKQKKQPILFSEKDVTQTMNQVSVSKFEETISIHNNINVTFFNNGHLIGSSIILVQISDPSGQYINILYTGDYKSTNTFLDLKPLPDWVYELDNLTIVTESTYGTTFSKDINQVWANNIEKACKNDSIIVIPAFSQGRMQEMMYNIKMLQKENIVPNDYTIEVAGKTGINYAFKYISESHNLGIKENMTNFFPNNLVFTTPENRGPITDSQKRRIIVTTSGMGTHGPANMYIPAVVSNPNAVIHFTGYTAENTLGRRLIEAEYGESVCVKGMDLVKKAKVFSTNEFSSHAKADELVDFLKKFKARSILITHGDPSVKADFRQLVLNSCSTKKVEVLDELVYRIDPYGIVKSIRK